MLNTQEYHTNSQHAASPCPPALQTAIGRSSLSGDGNLLVVWTVSWTGRRFWFDDREVLDCLTTLQTDETFQPSDGDVLDFQTTSTIFT